MKMMAAGKARDAWPSILNEAMAGTPTLIIRHSKPVALVIGYDEWQKLQWFKCAMEIARDD